jgi:membrane protein YdbS with pleckstrin-like domain
LGRDPAMAQQLDWVNILLLVVLAIVVVAWARGYDLNAKKKSKKKSAIDLSWVFLVVIAAIVLLIGYRYEGGRIININPDQAAPFDIINLVLLGISVLTVLFLLYITLDWRDDTLVLTNTRIILDKDEFLVRQTQQQILLVDVQQVSMRQKTYPEVIFGYGAITVQSFSLKRINFFHATRPQEMERRIKEELTRTRRAIEPNLVRRLIEERVYEDKKRTEAHKKIHIETKGANRTGVLAWLFPANPQIDEKSGQITWRPSSVYVALQMARPFLIWVVATIVIILAAPSLGQWLYAGILVWALVTLISAGWIFWLREEYVEDVYILNKREIIDVDRRPFGPVDRRSAPIDRIQNISFDVSFLEQILGYGTVKIQTGGSGDFTFNHVPDPRGVQAMVNDYLTDFKRGADERTLQNSIDVFREYHSLQRDKGELMDRKAIDTSIDEKSRAAVDAYANEIAPIQIAIELRQALRTQARNERRERVRRMMVRRRRQDSGPTA